MKKIFFVVAVLAFAINISKAQAPAIKKGTKFTYHVTTLNKEYDYVITLNSFGTAIAFDWMMTDPVNTSGKVTITAKALAKATSYKNYFEDDSKETLSSQSTVWLSKKNFNELKAKKKTRMSMTGEMATYDSDAAPQQITYEFKGTTKTANVLKCQFIKTADTQYTIQVFDDARNPLIQFMDLSAFTITLKSVE